MPTLKTDANQELIDSLDALEKTADECWRPLGLLNYPSDRASWALLARAVGRVEQHRRGLPPDAAPSDALLANLSRATAIALRWAGQHAQAPGPGTREWDAELAEAADQAIAVGNSYSHFEVCFQGFHKDLYAAELVAPSRVRFTGDTTPRYRQVRAFQQYARLRPPPVGVAQPLAQVETPRVRRLMETTLQACRRVSPLQFEYDDAWELWREMFPRNHERVRGLTRRAGHLTLGAFTLDEFGAVYAALVTIASAHDFLCFCWGESCRAYPLESAVIVRARSAWVDALSELSGITREKCANVLSDLTFDNRRSVDLHVHPMVPIDGADDRLAVAPPFPLHANHDENILRVCSQRRRQVFDVVSGGKEAEMLEALRPLLGRYDLQQSVALPDENPDIDLIIADDTSSTVVLAELKWIRKPLRALEIPDRDADVMKGIDQLQLIRTFLRAKPRYLCDQRRLSRPLTEYERVHYLLVARDHWRWVDPGDQIATVQFDAFAQILARSDNLRAAIDELLHYDWLPIEGTNFAVRFENAGVNGVSLESELFYAI
jgi:hypothetical protein